VFCMFRFPRYNVGSPVNDATLQRGRGLKGSHYSDDK